MKLFPTPASLLKAFRDAKAAAALEGKPADTACTDLLARVPITLSRKVGGAAARAIYDVLFALGPGAVSRGPDISVL
jgi:hypothetical protein